MWCTATCGVHCGHLVLCCVSVVSCAVRSHLNCPSACRSCLPTPTPIPETPNPTPSLSFPFSFPHVAFSVKCFRWCVYVFTPPFPSSPHSAKIIVSDFLFFPSSVFLPLLFSVVALTSVCSPCVSFCFYSRSLRARLFIACLACRCDVKSSSSSPLSSALLWRLKFHLWPLFCLTFDAY